LSAPRIFDEKHYEDLNSSRAAVVSTLLAELKQPLGLNTALDVGCGLGYFSGLLRSLGLDLTAVDGRPENAEEAARRNPGVKVHTYDAEDPGLRALGKFDLVFCFGLLYHLENPLLAIRHLHAMTKKLLLIEAVIFPGDEPIMALIDEEVHEDQGLNHIAFYPTEACLVKMIYRSGMKRVYRPKIQPDHPDYRSRSDAPKIRSVLAATNSPVSSKLLEPMSEPSSAIRPWDSSKVAFEQGGFQKLRRFLKTSIPKKIKLVRVLSKDQKTKP
jgi:SAM-dependent methyltransferase